MSIKNDAKLFQGSNIRRLQKEISQIEQNKNEYSKMFTLKMVGDNMYHWKAIVNGPEDSLYEGYCFELDIQIPNNYPFSAPNFKFVTPIMHMNVNTEGNICLDILKDKWGPAQNLQSLLVSLRLLMSIPNPDDPFNSDLAHLYRNDFEAYKKKVLTYCKEKALKQN